MKKMVCTISLLLTALLIAGCADPQSPSELNETYTAAQYQTGTYESETLEISTEAKEAEAIYLAGWMVISEGRLYLNEARVYVIGSGDNDPFLRYTGENFIVASAEELEQMGVNMVSIGETVPLYNDIISFELTDETIFTFTDTSFFFTQDMPPRYYTTRAEEFLMHLHFQSNGLFNVYRGGHRLNCLYDSTVLLTPTEFFSRTCQCAYIRQPIVIVRVHERRVLRVIEEFLFTQ